RSVVVRAFDELELVASFLCLFLFFKSAPPTEVYALSLHDALPIFLANEYAPEWQWRAPSPPPDPFPLRLRPAAPGSWPSSGAKRSEEHTSELQSRENLVCRLLLEKKNAAKRAPGTAALATHHLATS